MGRPPKANRDEVADVTLSFRFTLLEREALERLAKKRNAELRGTGATVTATSLGRAAVCKELDDSGVYAEVEREWRDAGKLAAQPPAQPLLPGLGDVAPEPRRTWGTSAPAPAAPVSAATPPPAVSNATPKPTPVEPAAVVEPPPAVELPPVVEPPAPVRKAPSKGKALNGSAKPAPTTKGKPAKRTAPASKNKTKPSRPALKGKGSPAPATPPRGRQ